LDQATEKFRKVLLEGDKLTRPHASFGLASCMMLGSKRDTDEGKYGRALSRLITGINALESTPISSGVLEHFFIAEKLLGDLHSSASLLPPSVFKDGNDTCSKSIFQALELKLDFIRKGEIAYQNILKKLNKKGTGTPESLLDIHATAFCDLGINKIFQMNVLRELCCEEYGINDIMSKFKSENESIIGDLFNEAVGAFKDAIRLNPLFSLAWCGLGCAMVAHEPLLAQHAFCRALQIDKSGDDSWTNLILLYLENYQIDASEEAVDLLTQVADTSMMWITRGLIAEEKAKVSNASDAYRASLNICRSSQALLGLASTCRWFGDEGKMDQDQYTEELKDYTLRESCANMTMFRDMIGDQSPVPNVFSSIMRSEKILKLLSKGSHPSAISEMCKSENISIQKSFDAIKEQFDNKNQDINNVEKFGINDVMDLIQTVSGTIKNLETFPIELVSQVSSSLSEVRINIILNPDSADAWLDFSKELVKSASVDNSEETLKSIEAVMFRTKNIMETNVTEPCVLHPATGQQTGNYLSLTARAVESCKFAEACALSHWIADIIGKNSTVDLQRSLILDPTNTLARSGL
jgi:tetratricopeptide (TPR) repeat protein